MSCEFGERGRHGTHIHFCSIDRTQFGCELHTIPSVGNEVARLWGLETRHVHSTSWIKLGKFF